MTLDPHAARARLAAHDHAVLCTTHPGRGVDAVPVVYAVDPLGRVGVPVDRVKPKSSTRLQRERNLERDPRATLLAEHWHRDDWSRLWWVRAELRWDAAPAAAVAEGLAELLEHRYPQYTGRPFVRVLVFDVVAITGWSAS